MSTSFGIDNLKTKALLTQIESSNVKQDMAHS
jgi:hypothetical protein